MTLSSSQLTELINSIASRADNEGDDSAKVGLGDPTNPPVSITINGETLGPFERGSAMIPATLLYELVAGLGDWFTDNFPISNPPIINGQLLERVNLVGGFVNNVIPHTLGRDWVGWIITRMGFATTLGEPLAGQSEPKDQSLVLRSQSDTTVDIWIF